MRQWPVICLAGPTGCGKTELAIAMAAELGLEIVNADSRQVYADLPIITAQPDAGQRAVVPHHLYGFLPSGQKMSAGRYAGLALEKIAALAERGVTPLLVGGTGFYFSALLRGMSSIPPVDPAIGRGIWERVAALGSPAMHAELARADPASAARIHPNDRQRVARALEVLEATGRTLSWWQASSPPQAPCSGPLVFVDAGLDWLLPRLESRIGRMLEAGALDEAARARRACPGGGAPAFDCIGVREALDCVAGRISPEQCRLRWLARTRAYAKRQLTWFRAQPAAVRIAPGDLHAALAAAAGLASRPSRA